MTEPVAIVTDRITELTARALAGDEEAAVALRAWRAIAANTALAERQTTKPKTPRVGVPDLDSYASPLFSRQQMRYWLREQRKVDEHQAWLRSQQPVLEKREAKQYTLAREAQLRFLRKHNARGVTVRPIVAGLVAAGIAAKPDYMPGCDVDYVRDIDRIVVWLV